MWFETLVLEVDQFQVLHETVDSCVGALIAAVVLQDPKGLGAHLIRVALILLDHVFMAVLSRVGLFEFFLPELTAFDRVHATAPLAGMGRAVGVDARALELVRRLLVEGGQVLRG